MSECPPSNTSRDRRRIAITGITGTLGEALARVYRDRGDEVIGVTHREEAESSVCDRLVYCAQRTPADAKRLIALGADILILNAARIETQLGSAGLPLASAVEEIHTLNAVFPSWVAVAAGESGTTRPLDVVAIGSIADGSPSCFGPIYHASKAALHHFYTGTGPIVHAANPNVRIRLYRPGVIQGPLSWAPLARLGERGRAIRAKRCRSAPPAAVVAQRIATWIDSDGWVGSDREPLSFQVLKLLFAIAPNAYYRLQRVGWRRGSRFEGTEKIEPHMVSGTRYQGVEE